MTAEQGNLIANSLYLIYVTLSSLLGFLTLVFIVSLSLYVLPKIIRFIKKFFIGRKSNSKTFKLTGLSEEEYKQAILGLSKSKDILREEG